MTRATLKDVLVIQQAILTGLEMAQDEEKTEDVKTCKDALKALERITEPLCDDK